MAKEPKEESLLLYQQTVPFRMRKGDLRKLEIVQAALKCVGTVGVEDTSFESVGKLCGLARPHVAYYFPRRSELIEAAIRYAYAGGQQAAIEAVSRVEGVKPRLTAYVKAIFTWLAEHPHHRATISLLVYLASYSKEYRKLSTELKEIAVSRLTAILSPTGPTPASRKLADRLHTILTGEAVAWSTDEKAPDVEEVIRHTTKLFLEAIA